MTPEKQVPLQETCRLMEEAGIEFDSHWSRTFFSEQWILATTGSLQLTGTKLIPSPTIPELLEEMPESIDDEGIINELIYYKKNGVYHVKYWFDVDCSLVYLTRHENLAEALAQMLLWLHENEYCS